MMHSERTISYGTLGSIGMDSRGPEFCRAVLDASQLQAVWLRCSLSSDFWSRYLALRVPQTSARGWLNRAAFVSTCAYLFNELFENCAKFSSGPVSDILFCSREYAETFEVLMVNHIEPAAMDGFERLIREILEGDPDELYFRKLEANAEGQSGSGLGYLTLIKDWGIRFGFRFVPLGPHSIRVEVHAQVSKKET